LGRGRAVTDLNVGDIYRWEWLGRIVPLVAVDTVSGGKSFRSLDPDDERTFEFPIRQLLEPDILRRSVANTMSHEEILSWAFYGGDASSNDRPILRDNASRRRVLT
jgi:hypothetical protein